MTTQRRQVTVREALDRLNEAAAAVDRDLHFMEVCGTHTVNAFRSGLHSLMPENVTLLSGPGCPVCVTAQGDIDMLIELGRRDDCVLCTYGDMIRVPGESGSLEQARSDGADVRVVYSALDAVKMAAKQPDRQFVFAAVGFETTTPATAVAVLEAEKRGLDNFFILVSHKVILPAMRALLDAGEVNLDGFLCPGHVSVILGAEVFRPIVEEYSQPCVIAGFEDVQIAGGMMRLVELAREDECRLENQYPQAVTDEGNRVAQQIVDRVFEPDDERWRALGVIPGSGLKLRPAYRQFDAEAHFALEAFDHPEPAGCRCGQVITGLATPNDCALFGRSCTPIDPVGPCMVSSEGTCQAWFKYARKPQPAAG